LVCLYSLVYVGYQREVLKVIMVIAANGEDELNVNMEELIM
jgi:hypothetical protein